MKIKNLAKKKLICLAAALLLSACAPQYTYSYNEKTNLTRDQVIQEYENDRSGALSKITPLPAPVSTRRLVVSIPSQTYYNEARLTLTRKINPAMNVTMKEIYSFAENEMWYRDYARMSSTIRKKNIFQQVEDRIIDGSGTFQPSDSYDILGLTLALDRMQKDQWHYYSLRNGKQVISLDQSSSNSLEQMESLLSAITASAIQ